MERELTLATLTLSACGSALMVSGAALPAASAGDDDGRGRERACARRLVRPVAIAALVFAALLGWSLQEPDITSEALSPWLMAAALAVALVWVRAAARAMLSLLGAARDGLSAARTVGLLRPRVVIGPALSAALDASELRAVQAHERAHARNRDPLRIWLGQLLTDLQWPLPAARAHLGAWRHALELARDDEARAAGVDGADLASAILKTARISVARSAAAAALVDEEHLTARVARLLRPLPASCGPGGGRRVPVGLVVSFAAAVALGEAFGEAIVRAVTAMPR